MEVKLFLFDIDGTLVNTGGAGRKALDLAFREVFAVVDAFSGIRMSGKTDVQIIREGLALHKISSGNGVVPRMVESYLRNLRREIDNPDRYLYPGIKEALDILRSMDSVALGLITGNMEEGARVKLEPFGLNPYFPTGAFGSDSEDRNLLLPVARRRFEEHTGRQVSGYEDCVVIGDTPRDVESAKPYGARSVGVATGTYSREELTEAGADLVLTDMGSLQAFMDFVF
jgi:phosphoglycolate phosphatase-like HAD superfamily hydrolase